MWSAAKARGMSNLVLLRSHLADQLPAPPQNPRPSQLLRLTQRLTHLREPRRNLLLSPPQRILLSAPRTSPRPEQTLVSLQACQRKILYLLIQIRHAMLLYGIYQKIS